jgi:hypothetical protein
MLRAPAAKSTTLAALVLAFIPACRAGDGGGVPSQTPSPPAAFGVCSGATSSPSMPRVLLGPDVDVRVFCGGTIQAPCASVEELGAGVTRWSLIVTGDAAFAPGPVQSLNPMGIGAGQGPLANTFAVCQASSPEVAMVDFSPPADALPGSTFDSIATVHSEDGSFADGIVKLHGEVTAPVVTVDKTSVDFGNVAAGDGLSMMPLDFSLDGSQVTLVPDAYVIPPFYVTTNDPTVQPGNSSVWNVVLQVFGQGDYPATVPGEYSATFGWRAVPSFLPNTTTGPCVWSTKVAVHARVVADGGTDVDAQTNDASDGGPGPASDGP